MNASQSFKIYEILQRHFKNDADAKALVAEIQQVIENKINDKKDILATKEDIARLKLKIENRFNGVRTWIVGTGIGIVGLIFTVIKLFVVS